MLPNIALAQIERIINKNTKTYRATLNNNVHVVDISYEALLFSDPLLSSKDYNILLGKFKKSLRVVTSLALAVESRRDARLNSSNPGTRLVIDPSYGEFLVGVSYNAIQAAATMVLKSIENTNIFTGVDEEGKTVTNMGHIASSELANTRTPLKQKLNDLLRFIPTSLSTPVQQLLDELCWFHTVESSYVFQRNSIDNKGLQSALGKGAVLLTFHSTRVNSELAKVEAKIMQEVSAYLKSDYFINALVKEPGSKSIIQDIEKQIIDVLKFGANTGSIHTKKAPTVIRTKQATKNTSGTLPSKLKLPQLRTVEGTFVNLTKIMRWINYALQKQIKDNMGTGNSRNVLNFRTGRLSESAKVERLSQSREGMITAFYSYMKYPYATFSEGGRQELPRSRDPKILVSKSIREVASTIVGNRLRAVSI